MKRIISLLLLVAMTAALAVSAAAMSYKPTGECTITFDVKQADPANVVKDGVIGTNEYEKLDISNDPNTTNLCMTFGLAQLYDQAAAMCATMEYYFSWDTTHGFNFAVITNPPGERVMNFSQGTTDPPGDDFLCNGGLQVELDPDENRNGNGKRDHAMLYYAIGKNPTTGEYLEGWYVERGIHGNYDPVAGTDYCITTRDDGSIVYEWSVPFDVFTTGAVEEGLEVHVSIGTYAGSESESVRYDGCFGVGLGDFVFMGEHRTGNTSNAIGTLSSEMLSGSETTSDTTAPGTTAPSTTEPVETKVKEDGTVVIVETTTDENGEIVVVEREATEEEIATTNTTPAAQTADPIIAVAAVCALSAGAVLALRKKH